MTTGAGELEQVLCVVFEEIPSLLKALASMASLHIGKEMTEAAASFYEELQQVRMPDQTALKLTEDYVSIFTDRTQEVMAQALASRMLHKAKHEMAEEEKKTKKGLSDRFSNMKGKIRKAFRASDVKSH